MKKVLVVGGGPAGLSAAEALAGLGFEVYLVEKEDKLGGLPVKESRYKLFPYEKSPEELLNPLAERVKEKVRVFTGAEVEAVLTDRPPFDVRLTNGETLRVDALVLATGVKSFDPTRKGELGFKLVNGVVTNAQLEAMLARNELKEPGSVAFVFCVGSRDLQLGPSYAHCCSYGCAHAGMLALELKRRFPSARVYCFYTDVRTCSTLERRYYLLPQREGVRYVRGRVARIYEQNGKPVLKFEDTLLGRPSELAVDLAVLVLGLEPSEGTKKLARLLSLKQDESGFIAEEREGVFVAGSCKGLLTLQEALTDGKATALRAALYLKGEKT
ncbi:MAG: CoB--CoM heterodisulfide reductase iron-sulfur subunit A family protein [Aquificae bacterium]|nr:CoB--CoM heterodisulfide reductase iron-sulfur subunit A family protein [Aquificota bacterium]